MLVLLCLSGHPKARGSHSIHISTHMQLRCSIAMYVHTLTGLPTCTQKCMHSLYRHANTHVPHLLTHIMAALVWSRLHCDMCTNTTALSHTQGYTDKHTCTHKRAHSYTQAQRHMVTCVHACMAYTHTTTHAHTGCPAMSGW